MATECWYFRKIDLVLRMLVYHRCLGDTVQYINKHIFASPYPYTTPAKTLVQVASVAALLALLGSTSTIQ